MRHLSSSAGFDLLYEEGPCLVVSKPGGLLTQGPPGIDSLEVRVKQFLKERDQRSGEVYLGVPHRLDRPATGAIVLGKHVRAARRLSEQFSGRTIEKDYFALLEGHLDEDEGTWQDSIRKIPGVARAEIVAHDVPEGRRAVLHYRVLARSEDWTWVAIRLETGRNHQIRVQAASRNHSVAGDVQYGAALSFGPTIDDPRDRWIALHAHRLRFRHPMTRDYVEVAAPTPDVWPELPVAK
jgi:23S rRNA pseudouridine1911/1915/1917 synthase